MHKRALGIPYVNSIDFFAFCSYKKASQKHLVKNLRNVFIYKKPDTFQKARQFPLRFYIQKAIQLTLWDFHEFLKLAFLYKKHDTLRYVMFLYTKS